MDSHRKTRKSSPRKTSPRKTSPRKASLRKTLKKSPRKTSPTSPHMSPRFNIKRDFSSKVFFNEEQLTLNPDLIYMKLF